MAATGSNQTLAIVGLIHGNCMQQGLSMFLCPAHIVCIGGVMDKPSKTIEEQIELIESRGMMTDDNTPGILLREG